MEPKYFVIHEVFITYKQTNRLGSSFYDVVEYYTINNMFYIRDKDETEFYISLDLIDTIKISKGEVVEND